MTEISVVIASTEAALIDVAKQATGLAMGLQNVSPANKTDGPNKSVQYLLEIADHLNELASQCKKLLTQPLVEQSVKLHELANQAVNQDKETREKYLIVDKFRFIRDRINAMLVNVENLLTGLQIQEKQKQTSILEDEVSIFVYLFNAQGILVQTWNKMVTPTIFYEHSVNRPIYIEKNHIEAFISRKPNKPQHAYLTVVIKKTDILTIEGAQNLKDAYEHPLVKVREGSLKHNKFVSFTHNGHEYVLNDDGVLVKKE